MIWFTPDELPALRERIRSGREAGIWKDVLRRADVYAGGPSAHVPRPENFAEFVRSRDSPLKEPMLAARWLMAWTEALGPAFHITGEARYGDAGAALLLAAARAYPVDSEAIEGSRGLARGELARAFGLAYDMFAQRLDREARREAAAVCRGYTVDLLDDPRAANWHSNWSSVMMGGAGIAAIALRDAYPDASVMARARALRAVRRWLDQSFGDGAYLEGSAYINYGMANTLHFAEGLSNMGGPELFAHPNLRATPAYIARAQIPGTRTLDPRNDNAGAERFPVPWMLRLAHVNGDGLARWLWERRRPERDFPLNPKIDHSTSQGLSFARILWNAPVEPVAPAEADVDVSRLHLDRGLVQWRSGWEPNDALFSLEAGIYHVSGHNQADVGHFNFYSHGVSWAADTGYGNRRVPGGRSQGASHSLPQIDGKSQAMAGGGIGVDGQILDYAEHPDYWYVLADATEAYNVNVHWSERKRDPEKATSELAAGARQALRRAVFLRASAGLGGPAVLIVDDLRASDGEPRDYTWRMYSQGDLKISADATGYTLRTTGPEGPKARLDVRLAGSGSLKHAVGTRTFEAGSGPESFRLLRSRGTATGARFIALLASRDSGVEPPRLRKVRASSDAHIVKVGRPSGPTLRVRVPRRPLERVTLAGTPPRLPPLLDAFPPILDTFMSFRPFAQPTLP